MGLLPHLLLSHVGAGCQQFPKIFAQFDQMDAHGVKPKVPKPVAGPTALAALEKPHELVCLNQVLMHLSRVLGGKLAALLQKLARNTSIFGMASDSVDVDLLDLIWSDNWDAVTLPGARRRWVVFNLVISLSSRVTHWMTSCTLRGLSREADACFSLSMQKEVKSIIITLVVDVLMVLFEVLEHVGRKAALQALEWFQDPVLLCIVVVELKVGSGSKQALPVPAGDGLVLQRPSARFNWGLNIRFFAVSARAISSLNVGVGEQLGGEQGLVRFSAARAGGRVVVKEELVLVVRLQRLNALHYLFLARTVLGPDVHGHQRQELRGHAQGRYLVGVAVGMPSPHVGLEQPRLVALVIAVRTRGPLHVEVGRLDVGEHLLGGDSPELAEMTLVQKVPLSLVHCLYVRFESVAIFRLI